MERQAMSAIDLAGIIIVNAATCGARLALPVTVV
jgi:hypothetical protein